PSSHQRNTKLHHRARTGAIHQTADQRAHEARYDKTEGEGARSDAALPAELVQDRREEQRERGARVDADPHRDEGDGDDDPAVEERKFERRLPRHGRRVHCPALTAPTGASPLMIDATCRTVSSA